MGIPTSNENPKGLHQKYVVRKVVKVEKGPGRYQRMISTAPDPKAEYFVMRVDQHAKDQIHAEACRKAVCYYAELIKDHLPELSKDLLKRYNF